MKDVRCLAGLPGTKRFLVATALGTTFAVSACSSGPESRSEPLAIAASNLGPTIAATASTADAGSGQSAQVAVTTHSGVVVGRSNGVVSSFLGIPYAAPPVGSLRWRAPHNHAPWSEPLDASSFGSACPQTAADLPPSGSLDEDCLTLNVWASSTAPRHAPVMVFFHGGGFFSDTGADVLYDGSALAQHGVVVVTLNYRLAQLGFLAHPALEVEDMNHHSSGNYGLLDQQMALRWVKANIAAFGGDPAQVTIFGQSAGAISVCLHLVSPLSAGLFNRAIQESGSCSVSMPLHDTPGTVFQSAESLGRTFAAALGCDTAQDVAACMRAKSVSDVLAAAPRTPLDGLNALAHYEPNIDGSTIPAQSWTLIQGGDYNAATWIGGANHDEGLGLAFARAQIIPISTDADYLAAAEGAFPGRGSDIVALYPSSVFGSPLVAYGFFLTDSFNCTMRRQAQWMEANGAKPYLYQFSRVNGLGAELGLGAFHGEEIPYVFGNFVSPYTVTPTDLSDSAFMMGAWTQFAANGTPNSEGQPAWTPYRTATDNFMQIADTVSMQTGLSPQRCDTLSAWGDKSARDEERALEQANQP